MWSGHCLGSLTCSIGTSFLPFAFYWSCVSSLHISCFLTHAYSCQNWFSLVITPVFRFPSRSEKHLLYFCFSVHCLLWIKLGMEVLKYQGKACCHNEFDPKSFEVIHKQWFPIIAFGLWIHPWLSSPTRSISIKNFSKDSSDGITSLISWIMLSEDSDKRVTTWKLSLSPQARIKAPLQSWCSKFHKQWIISALQTSCSLVSPGWERIHFLDSNTRTICCFWKHSLHYWNDLNSGAILLELSWHHFVLQRGFLDNCSFVIAICSF